MNRLQLSSVMVGITAAIIAIVAITVFLLASVDSDGTPRSAQAAFHVAVIDEVMTSYGGDASVQFVEIKMLAGSQNFVTDSVLAAFDANGINQVDVLIVPGDVVSGTNRPWLMATTQFTTVSGLTPDFVMPAGLLGGGGMVCWGKPFDNTNPSDYVDCLAYGTYSGPTNIHIGTPTSLDADGHSLQRGTDTNNNANDFSCADPATPTKNDFTSAPLAATIACLSPTPTPCAGDLDCDGVLDGSDNCPNVANGSAEASVPGVGNQTNTDADLGTAIPPATFDGAPIGDADGDACDSDDDDDGYLDLAEAGISTAADDNCTNTGGPGPGPNTDAWPSDMSLSDSVNLSDITGPFKPHFGTVEFVDPTGTGQGEYNPRVDLNLSGTINLSDITGPFKPDFGKSCT